MEPKDSNSIYKTKQKHIEFLKDCGVPGHFEFSGLLVCLFVLVLSGQ
jgi:hypothetical protein